MTEAEALAVFGKDLGTWDAELEIWPTPGAPGMKQKGTAENRMVGGRWMVMDFRAESGFEGHGVYGYDAALGRYVSVWVDGAGGGMARGLGTWDAAARKMTFESEAAHGGKAVRYREITETIEDGLQIYHHFVPTPDGEHEMIRTTYRRRAR